MAMLVGMRGGDLHGGPDRGPAADEGVRPTLLD